MNSETPRTDTLEAMGCSTPTYLRELEKEVNALRKWKAEALLIESEWDEQAIVKMLGGTLGESCRKVIAREVPKLIEERDQLTIKLNQYMIALMRCRSDRGERDKVLIHCNSVLPLDDRVKTSDKI